METKLSWNIFLMSFVLSLWRRQWHPTPVLLPGKPHGRRSLVGCSPWGHKESNTTERLHFHFSLSCIGEGDGNPLQCSCLENPRDGGAWWAAVYGVTQGQIRLKQLSSSSSSTVFVWWREYASKNLLSSREAMWLEAIPGAFLTCFLPWKVWVWGKVSRFHMNLCIPVSICEPRPQGSVFIVWKPFNLGDGWDPLFPQTLVSRILLITPHPPGTRALSSGTCVPEPLSPFPGWLWAPWVRFHSLHFLFCKMGLF